MLKISWQLYLIYCWFQKVGKRWTLHICLHVKSNSRRQYDKVKRVIISGLWLGRWVTRMRRKLVMYTFSYFPLLEPCKYISFQIIKFKINLKINFKNNSFHVISHSSRSIDLVGQAQCLWFAKCHSIFSWGVLLLVWLP